MPILRLVLGAALAALVSPVFAADRSAAQKPATPNPPAASATPAAMPSPLAPLNALTVFNQPAAPAPAPGALSNPAAPAAAAAAPASAADAPAPVPVPARRVVAREGKYAGFRALTERAASILKARQQTAAADSAVSAALSAAFDNAAGAGAPAAFAEGVPGAASGLAPPQRSLESIERLRMGTYNVENLFYQVGEHVPDPNAPGHFMRVSEEKPKPDWAMAAQGKLILESDLDVIAMQEVEDVAALEMFNERFLEGRYRVMLIEGNDPRGIDVAFLVKKDLPFEIEHRTHKGETWTDPVARAKRPLFSRDLPSLIFRRKGRAQPLFVLFGTHFKSKRDRPGDPEGKIMRAAQVQRAAEILNRYRQEFGEDVPIMLAGDFNGSVPEEAAFKPLYKEGGMTDAFDALPNPPSAKQRVSHTYHPRGGRTDYKQMDAFLVSKKLRGLVKAAYVYRYKNADGSERPLPKSYEERDKNPSDHFPIMVTLDFQPILKKQFPDWTPAPKPEPKQDEWLDELAYEEIKQAEPALRERVSALVTAYLSAAAPRREALYGLNTAYYEGINALGRQDSDVRAQLETLLKVVDAIKPRHQARARGEPVVAAVINTLMETLRAIDKAWPPLPSAAPKPEAAAGVFLANAKAWVAEAGPAFDAALAEWNDWARDPSAWILARGMPGYIDKYTLRNVPEIAKRLDALAAAKRAYAAAAASARVPATAAGGRKLYAAWVKLNAAAAKVTMITGDGYDDDLEKRGLIANSDQKRGHHPGGFSALSSAAGWMDWDARRVLAGASTTGAR